MKMAGGAGVRPVAQVLFTPDGRHLITGIGDGSIYIVHVELSQ
jgi:hypothetical protein